MGDLLEICCKLTTSIRCGSFRLVYVYACIGMYAMHVLQLAHKRTDGWTHEHGKFDASVDAESEYMYILYIVVDVSFKLQAANFWPI